MYFVYIYSCRVCCCISVYLFTIFNAGVCCCIFIYNFNVKQCKSKPRVSRFFIFVTIFSFLTTKNKAFLISENIKNSIEVYLNMNFKTNTYIHTDVHNWSLQAFNQDDDLAAHTTYVV